MESCQLLLPFIRQQVDIVEDLLLKSCTVKSSIRRVVRAATSTSTVDSFLSPVAGLYSLLATVWTVNKTWQKTFGISVIDGVYGIRSGITFFVGFGLKREKNNK